MSQPQLTGRQVRQLRSLAHHLTVTVRIGKEGITPSLVSQTSACLEAHELVKCSVLESADLQTRDAANELADRCDAAVVQVIGHRFALYRESRKEGIEHIPLD
ncbi:YhbY family RNA-binding protein [Olsenella sp. YH-ols2217]|uniref:YhbY family RNA-binding protein n=1 Tax=Kribbibacterium absianum TaxID=3044210 RepID=A0ABT6ZK27_9ACTN|nr:MULTISPECIES: YhbY family RNA-binding protein [unclassified Olsenella]MDJ1122352.1 YhbY family RNA-binding protein [Olsenella sp. YH-ols2216]MDJ1129394.1 YhbY family RNA-binding protein [Olsenella sp. YH-ols2217]